MGKVLAYVWVIEFQKRGLPHAHLLLTLDPESKLREPHEYDSFVCAEFPDRNVSPALFETIKTNNIHGPCGTGISQQPMCMENGKCTKRFPKEFNDRTYENHTGYPIYRRRNTGFTINVRGKQVDNRWVVPYNPYLSRKSASFVQIHNLYIQI